VNISQLLHQKGQTYAPPDTNERSLAIGRYYEASLNVRMLSQYVYPDVGQRGEIDNDCLYIHHPSRLLDLQSPLPALRAITTDHSVDLIDSLYLTGVHSTDSTTTSAFMIHLYIQNQRQTTSLTSLPLKSRTCTNKQYRPPQHNSRPQ
jgi:hypothetical protein